MSLSTKQLEERMTATREHFHSHCVVCNQPASLGGDLRFRVCEDGSVEASFAYGPKFQGYQGILHGGVIACILDSAMTNCLFAHGKAALTRELSVHYLHPARTDLLATVKAWQRRSFGPLSVLEARLTQNGHALARATGKFMRRAAAESSSPCAENSDENVIKTGKEV